LANECVADEAMPLATGAHDTIAPIDIAGDYSELLMKLEQDIPIDNADILAQARGIYGTLKPKLDAIEQTVGKIDEPDHSVKRLGSRFVREGNIIDLVHQLGETANRVQAARKWTHFAVRDERLKTDLSRKCATLWNLAEIRRVYLEYHAAMMARRQAMRELRALRAGIVIVVRRDQYSGQETPASPALQGL
jgi:hypothetical protein